MHQTHWYELAISAFSTFCAAAAAIAALLAVRESRRARKEERRSVRPYFTTNEVRVWSRGDGNQGLKVILINTGQRPARDLKGRIALLGSSLSLIPNFDWKFQAGEVSVNEQVEWAEPNLTLPSGLSHLYIALSFGDAVNGETYSDELAWKWEGNSVRRGAVFSLTRLGSDDAKKISQSLNANG